MVYFAAFLFQHRLYLVILKKKKRPKEKKEKGMNERSWFLPKNQNSLRKNLLLKPQGQFKEICSHLSEK